MIGGDGIGPEVIAEALRVLDAAGVKLDTVEFDLGGQRYLRDGEILSDDTLEELRGFDAILLGAVGTPEVPPGVIERGLLLKLRFTLDLYINQRPFVGPNHEFIVIRENTEGPYAGEGGVLRKGTPHEVATQGSVNTRMGVERCIRYAFELARSRPRRHLTLVHKTNVLLFSGDLWQRTFDEVAAEFPDVATAYHHVDAATIYFVQDPAALRRDRHRQPVRRHPHRPRRRRVGRRRAGQLGQPQPGAHRTEPVRAGPRFGARHRRHRARPTRSRRSCRRR